MVDVTDATFEDEVIELSKTVPVVVDLWAPWCGPCRTLGPIIEDVVAEHDGQVVLAKVNVDENPQISQAFRVQGIPAVYGLRNGQVLDSFVGAQGRDAVAAFVAGLLPSAEEGEVAALLATGDIPSLRLALELDPANEEVTVRLAELMVADDRGEEALELLARVPETNETRRVAALARTGAPSDDVDARLDALLETAPSDADARQELLDLLEVLGPDDPRTARYRKALTSRMF
ncbi:tetratricopeptide repeat protein [Iamia sp.]|uniref:tetratricopeptide repeat protein n=1 Tax=Iamia sp. TaxID=2722710 RepID=UPI002B59FD33|nr:tetratricopeptide repeat protein [Iamia sp.]HXH59536.1 tetratricopeptide repeat protein [Iamia sp.]